MADYPFPLADWTRAELYPKADALPLAGWAWEFLRRAPRYQRNFDRFEALGRPERLADWFASLYWILPRDPRRPFLEPTEDPEVFTASVFIPPDREAPPAELDPFELLEAGARGPAFGNAERLEALRDELGDPAKVTLTFDLSRSVEAQLERASELLRDRRAMLAAPSFPREPLEPERRARAALVQFPAYVRLLDADAAGASVPDMVAALYPREEDSRATGYRVSAKIRAALAAAKRLRDGGYRDLLA